MSTYDHIVKIKQKSDEKMNPINIEKGSIKTTTSTQITKLFTNSTHQSDHNDSDLNLNTINGKLVSSLPNINEDLDTNKSVIRPKEFQSYDEVYQMNTEHFDKNYKHINVFNSRITPNTALPCSRSEINNEYLQFNNSSSRETLPRSNPSSRPGSNTGDHQDRLFETKNTTSNIIRLPPLLPVYSSSKLNYNDEDEDEGVVISRPRSHN